ncbi:MAG: AlpA family phage regulatory protein [Colwellia sp.]
MDQLFTPELCQIADNMGLALYQRFTPVEASLFLRCPLSDIINLQKKGRIEYIQITKEQTEFFGYQLLNYLLNNIKGQNLSSPPPESSQERILRIEEVVKLTGISRTTIWRKERTGDFPARVPLSSSIVGWRASDISNWIATR